MKNLKKIKGDASFRQFFRKKNKNYNSIIVFSKKDKFKNLLVYDAINKVLIKNKILAPFLYKENYKKNYIEILINDRGSSPGVDRYYCFYPGCKRLLLFVPRVLIIIVIPISISTAIYNIILF